LIIGLACGIGGSIGAAKPVAGKPAFDAQAAEAESAGAV